jgi:uncharacterized SAM-binding protein YcdF (DUF218 family)
LTSVAGFAFARFVAAWVWGSCQTVFVWFSLFDVFLLYMFLAFFIMIWLLRNIEFRKMFVWKSGRQLPARARVRSTIFPLFVRKKKDNQTTHGCIVAVSFILGPPGLQTYVFSQTNSGNCNLLVLMLFRLGPAFMIF